MTKKASLRSWLDLESEAQNTAVVLSGTATSGSTQHQVDLPLRNTGGDSSHPDGFSTRSSGSVRRGAPPPLDLSRHTREYSTTHSKADAAKSAELTQRLEASGIPLTSLEGSKRPSRRRRGAGSSSRDTRAAEPAAGGELLLVSMGIDLALDQSNKLRNRLHDADRTIDGLGHSWLDDGTPGASAGRPESQTPHRNHEDHRRQSSATDSRPASPKGCSMCCM